MFYGPVAPNCGGKDHAFMPIAVRVVNDQEFADWVERGEEEVWRPPGETRSPRLGAAAQ